MSLKNVVEKIGACKVFSAIKRAACVKFNAKSDIELESESKEEDSQLKEESDNMIGYKIYSVDESKLNNDNKDSCYFSIVYSDDDIQKRLDSGLNISYSTECECDDYFSGDKDLCMETLANPKYFMANR